jgi:peptide/nickel transport system permease protein
VSAAPFLATTRWRGLRRLRDGLLVVWASATLVFVLLRLAPGDPYATRLDGFAVPESTRAAWRAQRGLDAPLVVQYGRWLANVVRGDLGWSTLHARPVRDVLAEVLPRTALLMSLALVTSLLGGGWLGAWQGSRAGTLGDQAATAGTLLVYSLPEFWIAMVLLQLFAGTLGWLPATGIVDSLHESLPFAARVRDRLAHLVLPWAALSVVGMAVFARFQRSALLAVWREPFVRSARAKGLREAGVRRHAWRASLAPVLMLAGLWLPSLLGGAVFVERIFAWPGMGYTTIRAVGERDYEFVAAAALIASALTVAGSLLADWLQALTDPRIAP